MSRPRSLLLNLEGLPAEATADGPAVLRKVIYNSLKDGGIKMDTIEGIECFSKVLWYVVFTTRMAKRETKDKTIELYGENYTLSSTEYERPRVQYTWVRLYGYPLDTDSTYLQKTMSMYGELVSLTDEMDGRLQIKTGVKLAQFTSLKGNIPSFVHVGRHRVRTSYRGQIKTCRNCHKQGHEVKDCTAGRVCKQCGEPGHTKGECPDRICFQCLGKGHEANDCPEYQRAFPRLGEDGEQTENQQEEEPSLDQHDSWQSMAIDGSFSEQTAWDAPNVDKQEHPKATETKGDEANPTSMGDSGNQPPTPAGHTSNPVTETPVQTDETTTSHAETVHTTADNPPEISETNTQAAMEVSPPVGGNTSEANRVPPLPTDSTDSSEEDEPPLKTLKTTTGEQPQAGENEQTSTTAEKSGKAVTAKVGTKTKKKKKSKGKQPAVNVAGGKNRNPFMQ